MRVGTVLGPVFTYESMIASRRWQTFATRSGFVAVLLLCLASVWSEDRGGPG